MAVAATDPREIEQALRKGGIEIRKLEAEASKAEADLIPALPATIPAGKLTTGDDASPLGVVAAYRSLAAAANMVVADLPADAVGVWVTGPGTAEACRAAHDVIETALSRLEAAVDSALSQLPEGPRRGGTRLVAPAALALAFTGLAAVIGPIASLLSTDRTIRSTDVSLGLNAIAAAVARAALEARSDRPVRVGSLPQADSALAGRLVALREKVESLG
ncbi:MAG: hypothetical protein QOK40_1593, partial [Miltoncostaeaceae bacterium]|nr:hypothetical protein [Miltoncostaeaceae bacterium]